jgi:ABC-type spermidine/putrescine transport system permease subunit II
MITQAEDLAVRLPSSPGRSAATKPSLVSSRSIVSGWAPVVPFVVLAGGLLIAAGLWLIRVSFAEAGSAGWSLQAWRDITKPGLNRQAILTSLRLAGAVSTLCVLLGTPAAWTISQLSARGRSVAMSLMNLGTNFGGASLAIAWVSTLGSLGFVRLLLADWLGVELGFDLFGFWGLVLVFWSFICPLFVLLVLPAMGALRLDWWEAAQTAGATRVVFWRRVGGPVLAPFVFAGWTLTFAWAIGQFSVPVALVGTDSKNPLITLRIGSFLASATGGTNRFERAAAMSVVLLLFSGGALLLYRIVARRSLQRLSGLGGGTPVGGSNRATRWLSLTPLALVFVLPIIATVLYSLATVWRNQALPDGLTTKWWRTTLSDPRLLDAVSRSLAIALLTVVVVNLIVLPPLYWSYIRNARLRTIMQLAALLPFALPFVVLAYGIKSLVGAIPLVEQFSASRQLLLVGHVALSFPFYLWPVDAALQSADVRRLHEAAAASGAGALATLRRVIIPNIRTGIVTGSVLVFATSLGEYSIARIITGTSFETLPVWQVTELNDTSGNPNGVAVIAVAGFVVMFVLAALVSRFGGGQSIGLLPAASARHNHGSDAA